MSGAISACVRGEWSACREHSERALSVSPGDEASWHVMSCRVVLAVTEFETGNSAAGERHLAALRPLSVKAGVPFPYTVPRIARITGDTRDLDAARGVLGTGILPGELPSNWWALSRHVALALIAVLRGDAATAEVYVSHFTPLKGLHSPANSCGMSTDALLGLLCTTLGRLDEACGYFEDALVSCRRAGARPDPAWTCRDYAETLLRRNEQGDRERASEVLGEGLGICRELGMAPLLAKIEALQRRLEGRGPVPAYPHGLTERELDVLRLVARGKTNKEIGHDLYISPKTVDTHVRSILSKTGCANRAEAAAYAVRAGLGPATGSHTAT